MDKIGVKKDPLTGKKIVLTPEQVRYELAVHQETECLRQRRQVVLLGKRHQVLMHGTDKESLRNKRVLNILREEARNVEVDLNVATSEGKLLEDHIFQRKLARQLHRSEIFDERLKEGGNHIGEIQGQITKLEKEVFKERAQQVTDREIQERTFHGMKKLETMENKLEVQTVKFGRIMTENHHLRDEIDHLIKERVLFNKMWEKYMSNLMIGKKFMLDLIEMATLAYDQREEWCSRLNALRVRAHNDYLRDLQEMSILRGKMHKERRLNKFMNLKSQTRVMRDLYAATKRKHQEQRKELATKIGHYKKIMDKIGNFTNSKIAQMKEVIVRYKSDELENFGKLQYLCFLNHEMEQVTMNIDFLNSAIDMKREQRAFWGEQQQQRLVALREELQNVKSEADQAVGALNEKKAEIKALLDQINVMFTVIKCDRDPIVQLLGKNQKVHERNVLIYLNVIERQLIDLILNVYRKERMGKVTVSTRDGTTLDYTISDIPDLHKVEQYVTTNPCPLCVQHQQVSDVIDIQQKVLGRDEIQSALQAKLKRPEGAFWLHDVSSCNLPESRQIIQRRYQ